MFFSKLKYRFDKLMSKGTIVLILLLFGITLAFVLLAGFIAMLTDGTERSFLHSVWVNFMYTLDAGNLSGADGNEMVLVVALLVTFCGLFFTSVLIGIISSGIENKMSELQRGKSTVFELDHIVILGFNEKAILILKELVISGSNHRRQIIVILDEKSKDTIENVIRQKIPDPKTTRFVLRSGRPDNIDDLRMCSLEKCRSIIITSDDDHDSLKSVLAITKILNKCDNPRAHMTVTVSNERNACAMRIAGDGRIETICLQKTIARIIAHSCLQSGISTIYTELFNFDGDEIYSKKISDAEGLRFDQANLRFVDSTLIGIVRNGKLLLNPDPSTIIEANDKLLLIAADDRIPYLSERIAQVDETKFAYNCIVKKQPQNLLVLGYSPILMIILSEEDKYLSPGSQVTIVLPVDYPEAVEALGKLKPVNIDITITSEDIYDRECLETLLSKNLDNVLVLPNMSSDTNQADNESMILLLQIRDIAWERKHKFSITTEIYNIENQKLISSASPADFIVSNHLIALIAAQVSQTRELAAVFEDLLNESGSEIYIKPVADYIKLDAQIDFVTISAAVAIYNEVFIGYKKFLPDGQCEIIINPPKVGKESFSKNDFFIVLAENLEHNVRIITSLNH
jgi:Trk K+ transport system NAD-binding subunit